MAQLNEADFESKYNNSTTGLFKTGQSRGIGSDKMRTLIIDIKDSFRNNLSDGNPTLEDVLAVSNDANGSTIDNLPLPTESAHAATKGYVDSAISAGSTLTAIVTVSSTDFKGSGGGGIGQIPKTIISAPGANKMIQILFPIQFEFIPSGAAYTNETSLEFRIGSIRVSESMTNVISGASDIIQQVGIRTGTITTTNGFAGIANQPLTLNTPTNNDPETGDGVSRVIVTYKVITL